MELGYQTNFDNARYPAKYNVGGYWDAASYTTPTGVPRQGRTAVYMQVRADHLAAEPGDPPEPDRVRWRVRL